MTIGVIVLLLGVGVLSYYLTMLFLKQTQRVERSTQYEHVIDVNPGSMESSNLFTAMTRRAEKSMQWCLNCLMPERRT